MATEPLTLQGAQKRLEKAGSDEDPIWLVIGGEPQGETTVSKIYYDTLIRRGCQDMAHNLQIRFRGQPYRRGTDRSQLELLEGTLADMVKERDGYRHNATPVATSSKPVLNPSSAELMDKAREIAKLRSDVLLGGYGRKGACKRHIQLALTALEQAEIWLALAAER
jgi:hypothetical protein